MAVRFQNRRHRRAHFNIDLGRWVPEKRVRRPLLRKPQKPQAGVERKLERIVLTKAEGKKYKNLKGDFGNRMREEPDMSSECVRIYLQPGNTRNYREVYPIVVYKRYFIFLDNDSSDKSLRVDISLYCVAHLERGVVIWAGFRGLSHAKQFAIWMDKEIKDHFMWGIKRTRIKQKLLDMGYRPLSRYRPLTKQ